MSTHPDNPADHDDREARGAPSPESDNASAVQPDDAARTRALGRVRARLADLSDRQSELRRREQDIAGQRAALDGAAVAAEQLPAAPKSAKRDRRLGALHDGLVEQEQRLAEQRAVIEETLDVITQREDQENQRRAEVRKRLAEKLDLIRQRKSEFIEKVQFARAELRRHKEKLRGAQEQLREQASVLEKRREAFEKRAADLEARSQELDARGQMLEARREEIEAAATDLSNRGVELASRQSGLERLAAALDEKNADVEQRLAELAARAKDLTGRERMLEEEVEGIERRRNALAEELEAHAAQRQELDRRQEELQSQLRELAERAKSVESAESELAEQRNAIDEQRRELAERDAAASERRAALDEREAKAESRAAELAERTADLAGRENALQAEIEGIERRRNALAEELETLAAQRRELEQRQEDLQSQLHELDARAKSVESAESELAEQTSAINQQRRELGERDAAASERRAALDEREAKAESRATELDEQVTDVSRREVFLRSESEELEDRRRALDEQDQTLRSEREALDERNADGERRARQLDERSRMLESSETEFAGREADLNRRDSALAARDSALVARDSALVARGVEIEAEAKRVRATLAELDERASTLSRQAEELESGRAELDAERQSLREREEQFQRRDALLAQRLRELKAHESDLEQRVSTNDARVEQLDELAAAMDGRADENARRQAEIEEQRASVDQLYQQAVENRDAAERGRREAEEFQDKLDAREAQLRSDSLQTEIDRERLKHDHAAVREQQELLAESEAKAVVDAASALQVVSVSAWRRLFLAIVFSSAAALLWYTLDKPRYAGLAEFAIAGERDSAARLAREHVDWIVTADLTQYWSAPPSVDAWNAAKSAGAVLAEPLPEFGGVRLRLTADDERLAVALLPTAVEAYAAYLADVPPSLFGSTALDEWSGRRAVLADELERRNERLRAIEQQLAETPASEARGAARVAFQAAIDEFKLIVGQIEERRGVLNELESREIQRGEVATDIYQQRLSEDAILQEDLKEFQFEVGQYRTELAVAMVLFEDPIQELRKSMRGLGEIVAEQRGMQPPPDVAVVLDGYAVEVEDFEALIAEFAQTWSRQREKIERMKPFDEVVELVTEQGKAANAAARLAAEARRVVRELAARIDRLESGGGGGTRRVVVASVLRGELSRLTEKVEILAEDSTSTDPASNFQLDAHDRQVRGLRTRLRERQQRVHEILQAEADSAARGDHDRQVRKIRSEIDDLDARRRVMLATAVSYLDTLGELEGERDEALALAAELQGEQAAASRLEERTALLDTQRPEPRRDSIELTVTRMEVVAGGDRVRDASVAGAVTFPAVLLLFALVLPRRRP